MKLLRRESARSVGGENGFLKRPGMVDEFDQQVSTSMDGKPIFLQSDCLEISTQHQHTDRQLHYLTSACLEQACQEKGHLLCCMCHCADSYATRGKHVCNSRALQPCLKEIQLVLATIFLQQICW